MGSALCSERSGASLLFHQVCKGKSHTSGPLKCTCTCTHVHTVNVLSSTDLRHHGPECSKEVMDRQGGGNCISGVFPKGQGGV